MLFLSPSRTGSGKSGPISLSLHLRETVLHDEDAENQELRCWTVVTRENIMGYMGTFNEGCCGHEMISQSERPLNGALVQGSFLSYSQSYSALSSPCRVTISVSCSLSSRSRSYLITVTCTIFLSEIISSQITPSHFPNFSISTSALAHMFQTLFSHSQIMSSLSYTKTKYLIAKYESTNLYSSIQDAERFSRRSAQKKSYFTQS